MKKIVLGNEEIVVLQDLPITELLLVKKGEGFVGVVHKTDASMWCVMSTLGNNTVIGYHETRGQLVAHSIDNGYTLHTASGDVIKLAENKDVIYIDKVDDKEPIFVAEDGKLVGSVYHHERMGWIVSTSPGYGYFGYEDTLQDLIRKGADYELEFYIKVGI